MGQVEDKEAAHQQPGQHNIMKKFMKRFSMDDDGQQPLPKPVKLKGHPGMDSLEDNP
jgi:hypothetical protein